MALDNKLVFKPRLLMLDKVKAGTDPQVVRIRLLTSGSLLKLPKLGLPSPCWRPEGGLPPLAVGWGMGDGDWAGEATLACPLSGIGMGEAAPGWGVLWVTPGESLNPNWIEDLELPTGPPFAP